jgi:hypothetical protein
MLAFLLTLALTQEPTLDLLHVPVRNPAQLNRLQTLLADVDEHHPALTSGYAIAYATAAEQAALNAAGIPFQIEIHDLQAWYAARGAADSGPRGGPVGSMGGFRTLAELLSEMDRLAATYPQIVSAKFSLGNSLQGRPIYAFRISTTPGVHDPSKPVAWFDALHHAREPMSAEAILRFADFLASGAGSDADATRIVATRNCIFIPCVNPDGYEYNRQTDPNGGGMWRKNRRNNGGSFGVDLNRNYGWEWGPQWQGSSGNPDSETYRGTAPFSEPETVVIRDYLAQQTPGMSQSCHTYGDLQLYSWGYDTVVTPDDAAFRAYGNDMASENGFQVGTIWQVLYLANGGSTDYHYGQHGTFAFTPEIGNDNDGFWPSPSRIDALAAAAHRPLLRTAQWTGGWVDLLAPRWTEAAGDGDSDLEPGESWLLSLDLQNAGVAAVNGTLDVSSASPHVSVSGGPVPLVLAVRGTGTSAALTIDFDPQTPAGTPIDLDLTFNYGGFADQRSLSVQLGGLRLLAVDAMESGDFGWTANNATNWSWVRANPEPTNYNGQPAQSGDDHSAAGTLCWVTGAAAGSSVGSNDVDGVARLTSPSLNLAEFSHVELAYWRWFANDPAAGGNDRFVAEASSNGGANWVQLESAANQNSWREVIIPLENFIALTDDVRIRFTVADDPNDDITEGLVDDIELRTRSSAPTLGLYGPTAANATALFFIDGIPGGSFDLAYSLQRTAGGTLGGIDGTFYLGQPIRQLASGTCDAEGIGSLLLTFPANAAGRTVHLQAVAGLGSPQAAFTNPLSLTFP